MKKYRYIIIVVIAAIAAAAVYGYREYYRKPAALSELGADLSITADTLLAAYSGNEENANKIYLGKILDVTGPVASVTNQQDSIINILLGPLNGVAHVSCSLAATEVSKVRKIAVGQSVTLRGVCTGYLMDVELNRCVILK